MVLILRNGNRLGRFAMLSTYLRIECKRELLVHWLGRKITQEKLWSHTICFRNYDVFAFSFREIYLAEVYFFTADTAQPAIIDCGANIGLDISYLLTHYPHARVRAFEADPQNFKLLKLNCERNGWTNVEAHNLAVYRSEGELPFYSHGPESLVSSLREDSASTRRSSVIPVRTVRLSTFVEGPVDFAKIDIEGAEEAVVEDLVESGAISRIRQMVFEYHHHMAPREDRLGRFLSLLEGAGFGYQLKAPLRSPFPREEEQFFMLGAYRKD